ncbi:hypothetical protein CMI37_37445 [Candidatus Pacearchaeota archaeon]|nr:hypothetical protein [Candidatus Pacearchaeota archaeon]|tara:strand:+ start:1175 stop:1459 length:285 start_codon:yes stop_codon:yes gene_type:complete
MAAGDISYDTAPVRRSGNLMVIHGTIEVDDTFRAFAILDTKSRIAHCVLTPEDGLGTAEVDINLNASGTATNGTIAVIGNDPTANTFRFRVEYA